MPGIMAKVARVLRDSNRRTRIIGAINKSPLRHISRLLANASHRTLIAKRRALLPQVQATAAEAEVISTLRMKGHANISHLIDQQLVGGMAHEVSNEAAGVNESDESRAARVKSFWVPILDENSFKKGKITEKSSVVATALQTPVLRIAAAYLGDLPYLSYVLVSLSKYSSAPLKVSQLWHLDRDDSNVLKMFVYLTDVKDLQDGPFSFLDHDSSRRVPTPFFMEHRHDDVIFRHVDRSRVVSVTGPRLTCFLVDSARCYHMGSRVAEGHERLMFTATFTPWPPIHPGASNRIRLTDTASVLERAVLAPTTL